jgi:hypothetical protein
MASSIVVRRAERVDAADDSGGDFNPNAGWDLTTG